MQIRIIILTVVFIFSPFCNAATRWNCTNPSDTSWFTSSNWTAGIPDQSDDLVFIGMYNNDPYWPSYNGTSTTSGTIVVGRNYDGKLTITGGTLTCNSQTRVGNLGNDGQWIQTGGTYISDYMFTLGYSGQCQGDLQISDGTIDVLTIRASAATGTTSTITQSGGTIYADTVRLGYLGTTTFTMTNGTFDVDGDLYLGSGTSTDCNAFITITGGKIIAKGLYFYQDSYISMNGGRIELLNGDFRDSVDTWVNQNKLKTGNVNRCIVADYYRGQNKTVVYASQAIYVSTTGSDTTGNGSKTAPYLTPHKARDAIRAIKSGSGLTEPVSVIFRGGTYSLDYAMVLSGTDSGTATCPITWRSYPGENVILSGGKKVTSTWYVYSGNIYYTVIPSQDRFWFRDLYKNGDRMIRSRWPNAPALPLEWTMTVLPKRPTSTVLKDVTDYECIDANYYTEVSSGISSAANNALKDYNTEIVAYNYWSINRHRARGSDSTHFITSNDIGVDCPDPNRFKMKSGRKVYFEHHFNYIDLDTEWYYGNTNGAIYYKAPSGENPNTKNFTRPYLRQVVRMTGTLASPVEYVKFADLEIQHGYWSLPSGGYNGTQGGYYGYGNGEDPNYWWYRPDSVIELNYTENCSFERCRFALCGAGGLAVIEGNYNTTIYNCEFEDLGGVAITLGDPDHKQITDMNKINDTISVLNNTINDCGKVLFGSVGIWQAFTKNTVIKNNDITNMPYSGISIGWDWNYRDTNQDPVSVSYNDIKSIMKVLIDGGGIYTLGKQNGTGTSIFNNRILNCYNGSGLYNDMSSSNIAMYDNIIADIGWYGFQQNSDDVTFTNNVVSDCVKGSIMRYPPTGSTLTAKYNIFYTSGTNEVFRSPGDEQIYWQSGCDFNYNIYYDPQNRGITYPDNWKTTLNQDQNSSEQNPLFESPANYNFEFQTGSPAPGMGIDEIDISNIGVQ